MKFPRPKFTTVTSVISLKEAGPWWEREDHVYIGMPCKAQRALGVPKSALGPWGKPWACLDDPRGWKEAYRDYLAEKIKSDRDFRQGLAKLAGQTLVCWCKHKGDVDCHGDLLAVAAEAMHERGPE